MKRRTACAALMLAASSALIGPAVAGRALPPTQQPAPVFRAGADAVSVDVSVQRGRRPVAGLSAQDFELFDNGVAQDITEVTYEKLPIDVTLLLDMSASVTGEVLDELRRALREVRGDLAAADRLRLVTFNMRVRRSVDFGEPASNIDHALASLRGAGSSAVFDALTVALAAATPPGRRQLIVLFTDGQDSSSITDPDTLLDMSRRSTPAVAVILASFTPAGPASLLRTSSALSSATADTLFERIATETGGMVTAARRGENLSSSFRRMLQDFRSSYVLYFTPRGVERAGAHTLDVRVKRAGVDVRARRSYVWR